jgi:hypothetical protein
MTQRARCLAAAISSTFLVLVVMFSTPTPAAARGGCSYTYCHILATCPSQSSMNAECVAGQGDDCDGLTHGCVPHESGDGCPPEAYFKIVCGSGVR